MSGWLKTAALTQPCSLVTTLPIEVSRSRIALLFRPVLDLHSIDVEQYGHPAGRVKIAERKDDGEVQGGRRSRSAGRDARRPELVGEEARLGARRARRRHVRSALPRR